VKVRSFPKKIDVGPEMISLKVSVNLERGIGYDVRGQETMTTGFKHVYGPVPSRRLGRSLGIDLVPYKTCTYDCVYCHLGRTTNRTIERKEYVLVEDVLAELKRKLGAGPAPDYISLAGSGEPTLNLHIGDLIDRIKDMTRIPVAVITNGSLLWMPEVQDALMAADLVLPSLDAGTESLFHHVNRPHGDITFETMIQGLAEFTEKFPGAVWLEVFLLAGITGIPSELVMLSALARYIRPERIQLNTVCRPPAEDFAFSLSTEQMLSFRVVFPGQVDIISERERNSACTDAISQVEDEDIYALLRRRPCTAEDVADGLRIHVMEALKQLGALISAGKVKTVVTGGQHFYIVPGVG
jgi:wyosine [tRNA(Phe)-imidazoG37] synthetase (radical SAM superfamily)